MKEFTKLNNFIFYVYTCVCLLHNFIQQWLYQLVFLLYWSDRSDLILLRVWCDDCSDFILSPAPGWCCPDHRRSVPGASGTGAPPPPGPQCPTLRTSINLYCFRNNHGNLHKRYKSGKPQSDLRSVKILTMCSATCTYQITVNQICVWEYLAMFIRHRSCWDFSPWTSQIFRKTVDVIF